MSSTGTPRVTVTVAYAGGQNGPPRQQQYRIRATTALALAMTEFCKDANLPTGSVAFLAPQWPGEALARELRPCDLGVVPGGELRVDAVDPDAVSTYDGWEEYGEWSAAFGGESTAAAGSAGSAAAGSAGVAPDADDPSRRGSSSSSSSSNSSGNEAVFSGAAVVEEAVPREKPLSKRAHIALEVLETEETFVHNLGLVIEEFLRPARGIGLLAPRELHVIFGNVEEIYALNACFLQELEALVGDGAWDDERSALGEAIVRFVPRFEPLYTAYVENHQDSILQVNALAARADWVEFARAVKERGRVGKLDILALLIQPVQRIPRYELLLKDLIKETPPGHPDLDDLKIALLGLGSIAESVNENLKKEAVYKFLQALDERVSGLPESLAITNRANLHEGPLTVVTPAKREKMQCYLFKDDIGQTPEGDDHFSMLVCKVLGTARFAFVRLVRRCRILDVVHSGEANVLFQLTTYDGSEEPFNCLCESPDEKQIWLRRYQDARSKKSNRVTVYQPDVSTTNSWVPDTHARICTMCGSPFTVMRRRHHCRNCGKVLCSNCAPFKRYVRVLDPLNEVRICKFCHDFLKLTPNDVLPTKGGGRPAAPSQQQQQQQQHAGSGRGAPSHVATLARQAMATRNQLGPATRVIGGRVGMLSRPAAGPMPIGAVRRGVRPPPPMARRGPLPSGVRPVSGGGSGFLRPVGGPTGSPRPPPFRSGGPVRPGGMVGGRRAPLPPPPAAVAAATATAGSGRHSFDVGGSPEPLAKPRSFSAQPPAYQDAVASVASGADLPSPVLPTRRLPSRSSAPAFRRF